MVCVGGCGCGCMRCTEERVLPIFCLNYRGSGESYHLGHGEDDHVRVPKLISTLANEKVVDVAVGSDHCLALTEDGDLYGWGKNSNGEVTTSCEPVCVPTLIENVPKNSVTYVSCGASHVSVCVCVRVCV